MMKISDVSTIENLSKFKFNNFSSIMYWKTNTHRYLRDKKEFYSTFIDVPVRRYWAMALGE